MSRLLEFLKGEAFRPHPMDINAPLRTRMAGRSFVFLKRFQNRWELKLLSVSADGREVTEEAETKVNVRDNGEHASQVRQFAREHETEFVVVASSLQMKFMERTLDEIPDTIAETQAMLVEDPRSILESAYQEDFRYFPIPNPFVDSTYLFHVPQRTVDETVSDMKHMGLCVCRVQSTIACGLKYLFDNNSAFLREDGSYLLMYDDEAYLGCTIKDTALLQPTWRSSDKFGNVAAVMQALKTDFENNRPKSLLVANFSTQIDLIQHVRDSNLLPEDFEIVNLFEEIEQPDQEVILYG